MQRSLVSYEDIAGLPLPPISQQPSRNRTHVNASGSRGPPSKKRRRSSNQAYQGNANDRAGGPTHSQNQNPPVIEEVYDDYEGQEESRELTQEEIWDDSALIEAWNAATEEYEVCRLLLS
jgi:hypothetical protein